MNAGDQIAQLRSGIAEASTNRGREVAIDISKCFSNPSGCPWAAENRRALTARDISGSVQGLTGLVYPAHVEVIWVLLKPVEAALFAVEVKLQVVTIAGSDLRYK